MSLKDKILRELITAEGEYRSGSGLAKQFSVSRTAIWKAIDQLKADGCEIHAVTNRGYRLIAPPASLSIAYLNDLLSGSATTWQPHYFPETDSTNNLAKRMAAEGAPAGTVVIADRQTAGRGRMGKSFHSPEGGLYFSVLLRPTLPLSDMMAVTACTASAVHLALAEFGITAQIKWVNDLFLKGRKICGILSEGSFNAELLSMDHLVIGIGINLQPDPALPEELRSIVTDIQTETGLRLQRAELVAAVLRHLEKMIEELPQRTYLPVYTAHSYTLGKQVLVRASQGERQGLAVGFSEDAGLIVAFPDGSRETIRTGTAQFVE